MIDDRTSSSALDLIKEMERARDYKDPGKCYVLEEQLLGHIFNLEKEQACQTMREILENVTENADDAVKAVHYYLLVVTAIVARKLSQGILSYQHAFVFHESCISLIETKLAEDTMEDTADELIELCLYVLSKKRQPTHKHHTVNEVIQYIDENVESLLVVENIAKTFNISTSHLSRIFREHTGITLVEYIMIRKVEESQYFLRFTDTKISQISDQFHFCNQSYYTRVFKKYTGETPMRFRNNLNGKYFRFSIGKED